MGTEEPAKLVGRLRRLLCTKDGFDESLKKTVNELLRLNRFVDVIESIRQFVAHGRIAKLKTLIATLAWCTSSVMSDREVREKIYDSLPELCPKPSHLFMFLSFEAAYSENKKVGFGRSKRRAIGRWYRKKNAKNLAMLVTKYKRRSNWSHCDLIRLAHVKPAADLSESIFESYP